MSMLPDTPSDTPCLAALDANLAQEFIHDLIDTLGLPDEGPAPQRAARNAAAVNMLESLRPHSPLEAALGTPVVVPFGSTSPELTGPGRPGDSRHRLLKSDAPCSPCFLRDCPIDFRCMNGIPVERVVEAVRAAQSR